MTLQHTLRRPDQSIQLGPRHGYRLEGDHVTLNAELQLPPYLSGGEWTLELWATGEPYRGGALAGVRIAQIALELPTPIGPYTHQVDTRAAARLPLQGRAYAMVLALVQHGPEGQANVHAFANYAEPQSFSAPHLVGNVGYSVQGREVVLRADGIFNPRSGDNMSGTLALELWAFRQSGAPNEGLRLAAVEIENIAGGYELPAVERSTAFVAPPAGRFQLALLLCEWTLAHGYVARDRRDFGGLYETLAPELPAAATAPQPAPDAVMPPPRSVDRLRLVPPTESEEAAASAAPAEPEVPAAVPGRLSSKPSRKDPPRAEQGMVSIQTASVEVLARVKGLNLKIAKEIVKARPFASVADLIRVRGLGQKTIDRLKGFVTI